MMRFNFKIVYRKNAEASERYGKTLWNAILVDPGRDKINWNVIEKQFDTLAWWREMEKFPIRLSGAGFSRREALRDLERQCAINALNMEKYNHNLLATVRRAVKK